MPETRSENASELDAHFTYATRPEDDLCQGDVLKKTEPIVGLLQEVHPHYLEVTYTHFLVLTQSCDLVRERGGTGCKSRYITLAPVRPLDLLIEREIEKHQKNRLDRVAEACSKSARRTVKQFLERLLNNNNPEYFYLHPDAELGFPEASCAFLRLAIGLRAYEHYELCLGARVLSLAEVFRAKLGWLVGNMYSRVATEDWVPHYDTEDEFHERIDRLLGEACSLWVEDRVLKVARRFATDQILEGGREAARAHISKTVAPGRRDVILRCVAAALRDTGIVTDAKEIERICRWIGNDSSFAASTKQ